MYLQWRLFRNSNGASLLSFFWCETRAEFGVWILLVGRSTVWKCGSPRTCGFRFRIVVVVIFASVFRSCWSTLTVPLGVFLNVRNHYSHRSSAAPLRLITLHLLLLLLIIKSLLLVSVVQFLLDDVKYQNYIINHAFIKKKVLINIFSFKDGVVYIRLSSCSWTMISPGTP